MTLTTRQIILTGETDLMKENYFKKSSIMKLHVNSDIYL